MHIYPNSIGGADSAGARTSTLREKWSDEARQAAAQARSGHSEAAAAHESAAVVHDALASSHKKGATADSNKGILATAKAVNKSRGLPGYQAAEKSLHPATHALASMLEKRYSDAASYHSIAASAHRIAAKNHRAHASTAVKESKTGRTISSPSSYKKVEDMMMETVSRIREQWSDAARAAAAASRGKAGKGVSARQAAGRAAYRKAGGLATGSGRMQTIKTDQTHISSHERPIDYGHVHELLQEKYGKGRGNKMYNGMIDGKAGLHFVVGTKIQKEKRAMMDHLGLRGNLDDHKYRDLHAKWVASTRK